MRAIQGTFPRLKDRLTSDKKKRGQIIMSCVLLHNLRTEVVGVNQIGTVFDGNYGEYFNLEGYDHIGRYFADIID